MSYPKPTGDLFLDGLFFGMNLAIAIEAIIILIYLGIKVLKETKD